MTEKQGKINKKNRIRGIRMLKKIEVEKKNEQRKDEENDKSKRKISVCGGIDKFPCEEVREEE